MAKTQNIAISIVAVIAITAIILASLNTTVINKMLSTAPVNEEGKEGSVTNLKRGTNLRRMRNIWACLFRGECW
jgi:hypothetical protein